MKKFKIIPFHAAIAVGIPIATYGQKPIIDNDDHADIPQAVVIRSQGICEFTPGGDIAFAPLKKDQVLYQDAIVRTANHATVDLFFRRIGTTVRLQEKSEVKLETMTHTPAEKVPKSETLLDLRQGRVFIAVRSVVSGSTLEVRNIAGRSVIEGGGVGRYIVTADGTQVVDKGSAIPLKVIGSTGVTVIVPGTAYRSAEGKMQAVEPSEAVKTMIQFDQLQDLGEASEREHPFKPQVTK